MNNRVENNLINLKTKGEKALIPYIMGGDPSIETTVEIALTLSRSGADAIEIGLPFSDPVADGPTIQKAAARALSAGIKVHDVFNAAKRIREKSEIPLVLMTYFNPVYQYGFKEFASSASGAGIDGVIVPDLPVEEATPLINALKEHNMVLVPLIAPNSGEERIPVICEKAGGFLYCVSVTGVTGSRDQIDTDLDKFTSTVRKHSNLPVGIGFGISGPRSASNIAPYCDAVIVGSSLVNTIDHYSNDPELYSQVEQKIRAIKEAITKGRDEYAASL